MTQAQLEAAIDNEMERWRGHFAATFTGLSPAAVTRTFEAMKDGLKAAVSATNEDVSERGTMAPAPHTAGNSERE